MLMIHCALLRIIAKILTLLLEYVPEITEVNAPGFNVIYYMRLCLQDHNIQQHIPKGSEEPDGAFGGAGAP